MNEAIVFIHRLAVTGFFVIYAMKTILLLSNKKERLKQYTEFIRIPDMIGSTLFLITGVYLLSILPVINPMMWVKIGLVALSIPVAIIGFKKGNKILAALSLLMITASYGIAEASKAKRKKGETVATTTIDGKTLYSQTCVSCHGEKGNTMFAGAADLTKTQLDVNAIKEIISNGKGTMLPIQVSNEQADAIANYVEANIKGK